jgi:FMN phosphatase YigB (HAD superfamily)
MKTFYKIAIITSLLCNITLANTPNLTPENTILTFDIDEVIVKESFWIKPKLLLGGIYQNPFNTINYIYAFLNLKNAITPDMHGIIKALFDDYGNPINGITFILLYQGMRDPLLTQYVEWILETMEHSRSFIDGTYDIISYLKKKGYNIALATNKDRVSYDMTAQVFGEKFTNLATKVFIAQPGNTLATLAQLKKFAEQPTTPESYKQLEYKTRTIQPTETIFHVPSTKPNVPYFQYIETIVGPDKNIVFIDDQLKNIKGFNQLQETTTLLRHGIQFENATQLAEELIKLGILSIVDDKEFLMKKGMYKNIPSPSQPTGSHL